MRVPLLILAQAFFVPLLLVVAGALLLVVAVALLAMEWWDARCGRTDVDFSEWE